MKNAQVKRTTGKRRKVGRKEEREGGWRGRKAMRRKGKEGKMGGEGWRVGGMKRNRARAKEFHCAFRMQAIFHQCYKTMKDRRVFENVWRLPALISHPEWR